ncbi:hypothetical protein EVAR_103997_1 [Eumeta japonica]|uniref:Uncharacterized protein n=1 Tax=Eumeta variegata TaxID=151549 RepID=A0A4C1Y0I6_EUMVA|nr:hypothetical protein EVAR_103997_1 [Eumeta japonica]
MINGKQHVDLHLTKGAEAGGEAARGAHQSEAAGGRRRRLIHTKERARAPLASADAARRRPSSLMNFKIGIESVTGSKEVRIGTKWDQDQDRLHHRDWKQKQHGDLNCNYTWIEIIILRAASNLRICKNIKVGHKFHKFLTPQLTPVVVGYEEFGLHAEPHERTSEEQQRDRHKTTTADCGSSSTLLASRPRLGAPERGTSEARLPRT